MRNKHRHCARFHRLQTSACSLIVCATMDLGDMVRDVPILHGESGVIAEVICNCWVNACAQNTSSRQDLYWMPCMLVLLHFCFCGSAAIACSSKPADPSKWCTSCLLRVTTFVSASSAARSCSPLVVSWAPHGGAPSGLHHHASGGGETAVPQPTWVLRFFWKDDHGWSSARPHT